MLNFYKAVLFTQCAAFRAEVAQLVEQSIRNRQVSGSSPDLGSIFPSSPLFPIS
jgi:hypothetical protein